MIPFMRPVIEHNPISDDIWFASRAEEIKQLPELLRVVLTSPVGLDMVNVGVSEPQAQHRNKPWFKVDAGGKPLGVFVWNTEAPGADKWENIAPLDVEVLTNMIQVAEAAAALAEKSAEAAQQSADRSKELADVARIDAGIAQDQAEAAEEAASKAAVEDGIVYGSVTDAVIDKIAAGETFETPWYSFTPPLDPTKDIVGFITLTSDSYPMIPFRYGVQVQLGGPDAGALVRGVGINMFATTTPRTISFMWMLKGTKAV